jgi:hypothetical protein
MLQELDRRAATPTRPLQRASFSALGQNGPFFELTAMIPAQ